MNHSVVGLDIAKQVFHVYTIQADRQITAKIKDALSLVDVRTLDHIIVGGMDSYSFAERG